MRLLLLADPGSIHTVRWARALSDKGISVYIFGLSVYDSQLYDGSDVQIFTENITPLGFLNKLSYLTAVGRLKRLIKKINPDIVHAHYASSYGLLGRLSGFKRLIISVWGTDIYDFPKKSFLHRWLLKYNLGGASIILSTSVAMAAETRKYARDKFIEITPFGIDPDFFRPFTAVASSEAIVIGTVKSLYPVYGVDTLIKSFAILKSQRTGLSLKLIIAGDGHQKQHLLSLAKTLNVDKDVLFLGKVPHEDVPQILNTFDIYAALSNEESFGVAVVEASACELPVVVSDAPGLNEVVVNGKTGIVVPRKDPEAAAAAFDRLIQSPSLRHQMGIEGRKHVMRFYDWNANTRLMIEIYNRLLNSEDHNKS